MRFKKTRRSPTSTNHSLNARAPLGNDECSLQSASEEVGLGRLPLISSESSFLDNFRISDDPPANSR